MGAWLAEKLLQEAAMIARVPFSFSLVCVLAVIIIWVLLHKRYKEILSYQKETIASLREKVSLSELEPARGITAKQKDILLAELRAISGKDILDINYTLGIVDSRLFAEQFSILFNRAGWLACLGEGLYEERYSIGLWLSGPSDFEGLDAIAFSLKRAGFRLNIERVSQKSQVRLIVGSLDF